LRDLIGRARVRRVGKLNLIQEVTAGDDIGDARLAIDAPTEVRIAWPDWLERRPRLLVIFRLDPCPPPGEEGDAALDHLANRLHRRVDRFLPGLEQCESDLLEHARVRDIDHRRWRIAVAKSRNGLPARRNIAKLPLSDFLQDCLVIDINPDRGEWLLH